ncbi:MAG TPA: hypothetical protein VL996_08820 [Methylocella sp.]|nr:hypothetical protein [Methylocella sp.]
MTKLEDDGGVDHDVNSVLSEPKAPSSWLPRSFERALLLSSALTVFSFVIHVLFLMLVDPLRVLPLSKETAYVISSIPLCFGVLFLVLSVFSFIMIEKRTALHIVLLFVALSVGSMSLQGLLGLGLHYVKLSL